MTGTLKYEVGRNYRKKLTLSAFKAFANGSLIALGTGEYSDLDKDNPKINWIAVKGYANDWCIYYGRGKDPHEYIHHNGKKITSERIIKEFVPCADEVLKLYIK